MDKVNDGRGSTHVKKPREVFAGNPAKKILSGVMAAAEN
jgi:hypothetical protein